MHPAPDKAPDTDTYRMTATAPLTGKHLYFLRTLAGYSQQNFGSLLGVSQPMISIWESARDKPLPDSVHPKLFQIIGITQVIQKIDGLIQEYGEMRSLLTQN